MECVSIQAAIELVAAGAARRVVLCGLQFGERLFPDAVAAGDEAGVSVRLDRSADGAAAIIVGASGAASPQIRR